MTFTPRPIAVFFGLALLLNACGKKQAPNLGPPKVEIVEVGTMDVPVKQDYVGEILGIEDIPIRARVDGFLNEMRFDEGTRVTEGQILYVIDPQPFEESVAEAQSGVASAKVSLVKAINDLNRIQPLAEINAVSQSDLDGALANKDAAEAQVEAAEANLRMAQIQLGYTRIQAPITGLIGKSQYYEGEYIGKSITSTNLNTISRTDSVRVNFYLAENEFLRFSRYAIARIKDTTDSVTPQQIKDSEGDVNLELVLADGSVFDQKGAVRLVNREVDQSTGSILIQAEFPNPDRLLRPGQFAKVRALITTLDDAVVIPQRSASELQGNYSVKVVNDSNQIEIRPINVTQTYRDYYVIESGVKRGEKIIFEGLQRGAEGSTVNPEVIEFNPQYPEK